MAKDFLNGKNWLGVFFRGAFLCAFFLGAQGRGFDEWLLRDFNQPNLIFKEAGPLEEFQKMVPIVSEDRLYVPSFRIQSFGNTLVRISAKASGEKKDDQKNELIIIEGPFSTATQADRTKVLKGEIFAVLETQEKNTPFPLKKKGIYRLTLLDRAMVRATMKDFTPPRYEYEFRCMANCGRNQLTLEELTDYLRKTGRLEPLHVVVKKIFSDLIKDDATREARLQDLRAIFEKQKKDSRFPTFPSVNQITQMREVLRNSLTERDREMVQPAAISLQTEIDRLGQCDYDRNAVPAPIHPALPEIARGQYDDDRLSDCEIAQSLRLGRIATRLANGEGPVNFKIGGIKYSLNKPIDFFTALFANGHRIVMTNERMYVNFFAMMVRAPGENQEVLIPSWIKTGITAEGNGSELVVPMGHTQHSWRIFGPLVSAKVAFFLGVRGVGFFGQVDSRPLWSGGRSVGEVASDEKVHVILRAIEGSTEFISVNRQERGKLPKDGYGVSGVCNDSNSFVENFVSKFNRDPLDWRTSPVTTYPNVREGQLNRAPFLGSLAQFFDAVPRDVELTAADLESENYRLSALCRILKMTPYRVDSPNFPDEKLREDLKGLLKNAELNKFCGSGLSDS